MADQHDEPHAESEMESHTMPHDSMVTVRLSEPPLLTVNTTILEKCNRDTKEQETPELMLDDIQDEAQEESPRITMVDPNGNEVTSPTGSESVASQDGGSRRGSDSSEASEGINWEELEKTEENEPRDEASDDVS
jgi:hypothetical protein